MASGAKAPVSRLLDGLAKAPPFRLRGTTVARSLLRSAGCRCFFGWRYGSFVYRRRWSRRRYRRAKDAIKFREILVEVRFSFGGNLGLIRRFAVAGENFLDHVHAAGHLTEGGETHRVETRIFAEADKKLSRASVGPGGGEGQEAGVIALGDGIVLDVGLLPSGVHRGIGVQAELYDETRDHAEESGVGEKSMLHQIIETVGAQRGPGARNFDYEITGGGFEGDFVFVRCGSFQRGGMQ